MGTFSESDTVNKANDTARYPYRLCHIADRGGDISKRWYLKFQVWDLAKQSLVTKWEYGDLSKHQTIQGRRSAANRLKQELDGLLKAGYVINSDLDQKQYSERSKELHDRERMTIPEAYHHALSIKWPHLEKPSQYAYRNIVNIFERHLKERKAHRMHLSTLTPQMVNSFFDWLKNDYTGRGGTKLSNTSINNFRTYFRVLTNVLINRERLLTADPSKDVPKLKEKTTYHEIYLDDEIAKVRLHLEGSDPQFWLLIQFVYYCFVRPKKEARLLQIKHLRANTLVIPGEVSKTDIRYPVIPAPLQKAIADMKLTSYPPDYYIFAQGGTPGPEPSYVNYWMNKWVKVRASLGLASTKTLYSFKHTGACKLYLATKDPNKVREQCGHTSLETTLIYLRQLGMFDNKEVENLFPEI